MSDNAASWQPDPTGKHDHRYWDGTGWTDNVADAGVAGTDPFESPVDGPPDPEAPTVEPDAPAAEEPTVVTPVAAAEDTTASYPAATPPSVEALPYAPPMPAADGPGSGGGSKRGLLIGGAILAAVALAVVAFLALSGDDDEPTAPVADESQDTTTTEGTTDDGEQTIEDLEDACADGDFRACDDLYFSADLGSELEDFGSTCGGIAEPQSGACEATNGGEEAASGTDGFSDGLTDDALEAFEQSMAQNLATAYGLSEDQAECLAARMVEAVQDGDISADEAITEFSDYLSDCDISLDEVSPN